MSQVVQRQFSNQQHSPWRGYVDLSAKTPQTAQRASLLNGAQAKEPELLKSQTYKQEKNPARKSRALLAAASAALTFACVVSYGYFSKPSTNNIENLISYKDLGIAFNASFTKAKAPSKIKTEIPVVAPAPVADLHVTVRNGKREIPENIRQELVARIAKEKQAAETQQIRVTNASVVAVAQKVYKIIKDYIPKESEGLKLAYAIVQESKIADFDPLFVAAVIKSESAFDRFATSPVGAKGLMQIMPATGKYVASFDELREHQKGYLTDAGYNLKLGIAYLKYLEEQFAGNKVLTLIAYNWGPGKVDRTVQGKNSGVPKEVMNYALKILSDHQKWHNEIAAEEKRLLA
jgi:soluble lytic murein transglycosylase-like protein